MTEVESGVIGGSAGRLRVYSRGRLGSKMTLHPVWDLPAFELPRRLEQL